MKDLTDWVFEREDGFVIENGVAEIGETIMFFSEQKQMIGVVSKVFKLVSTIAEVVEL